MQIKSSLMYNKNLKVGAKSVYNEQLMSAGLWVVADIFDRSNLIPFDTWFQRDAIELDRMTYYSIVNCIRK